MSLIAKPAICFSQLAVFLIIKVQIIHIINEMESWKVAAIQVYR